MTDAEGGETPLTGNMTVAAFLDRWIEHVRAHRQPDTTRNYALRCKRYKQEFGSVRLDKLRSHHIDDAYRRWLLEGSSPATIKSYHGVLSSALGQDVKWGLVSRSVAPLATLPTVEPRRMSGPDVTTVRLLVTTAEETDPVLSAAIMLAALTGCRRGELLGLRWSDVERDRMVLEVQRSVKREEFGDVLRVGPTTTHQAERSLSMSCRWRWSTPIARGQRAGPRTRELLSMRTDTCSPRTRRAGSRWLRTP
ncbi:MAG: site-specific integrase [Acidimicrobiales bacterium]